MSFAPAKQYPCHPRVSNWIDPRVRNRLLGRIRRRFDIDTRDLHIGPLVIPFTQIRNPDSVLDAVCDEADRRERVTGERAKEDDLHLPYWAELWDSAYGIAEYLCSNTPTLARSTLDLGCGMGLAGTVAGVLG